MREINHTFVEAATIQLRPHSRIAGIPHFPFPAMTSPLSNYTLARLLLSTAVAIPMVATPSRNGALDPNDAVIAGQLATFSSQLPILVIDTRGSGPLIKDGVDHPSMLQVYTSAGRGAPSFASNLLPSTRITLSVRGSSSAEFPKKSFALVLRDANGKKYAQPLLGLPAAETWVLNAPWHFDPGYINNAFVYALSNQMGRWAPRTRFVEVFLNSDGGAIDRADYAGIYVLTEKIELAGNRVALAKSVKNTSAVDSSYIFKIDVADPDEFSWNTTRGIDAGDSSVVLVAPKDGDATRAQRNYIRDAVQQMENVLHVDRASGWSQRAHLDLIDRASWIDHHILNTLAANPDALVRSAFFTKGASGRIAAGPVWDFDRALGNHADARSYRWDVWSGVGSPDVWRTGWWGVIAEDPEFRQAWIDRWQSLRRSELSNDAISRLVAELGGTIGAEAAARDVARWPDNRSTLGSHATQLDHLRGWTIQHAQWIDEQFVAAPSLSSDETHMNFRAPPGAVLMYTLDGSDPRSLGGAIAPNAETTPAALRVLASANAHVRSYRSNLHHPFPGSPWSSAVGTPSASPLLPRARLVNLSSRATSGGGDQALILGINITDTDGKRVLARAIGPGLATFGVTGCVLDPELSLFRGQVELARNRGWNTAGNAAGLSRDAISVGAFPLAADSSDSALTHEIPAGACTFQVSATSSGTALAEIYELDDHGRIGNLSARAMVRGQDGALLAGFVIRGPAYQRLLIRAVGPTLRQLGLSNALAAPILTLFSGANKIAGNERWGTASTAAAIARASDVVGAFKLDSRTADSAMLLTLRPAAYTVEVKGSAFAEGIVLLEIFDVP
jgi:hypothetical protein